VRGLDLAFGDRRVLNGIDLDIASGDAVALIGANGAGKSTLLRSLVRLVQPTSGSIRVLGEDVTGASPRDLPRFRSRVGFVFQKHNLVPRLSVLTNVVHGVQARRRGLRTWSQALARTEDRAEALDCLAAVGLADRAHQRADSLSGGQSQRVAIARMLMQRPALILADEPDASLDPRAGAEVMELMRRLARDKGLTFVFVSHRIENTIRYSERIVGLADGRITLDAPSASIDPVVLRAFFDAPPATQSAP
jgi:phosphonate transport system ATP-binding protein